MADALLDLKVRGAAQDTEMPGESPGEQCAEGDQGMMVPCVDPEELRTRKLKDWARERRDADEGDATERLWPKRMRLTNPKHRRDLMQ